MQHALHKHYAIHLREPISCEICAKFAPNSHENRTKFVSTAESHECWHVALNVNFVRISREFNGDASNCSCSFHTVEP